MDNQAHPNTPEVPIFYLNQLQNPPGEPVSMYGNSPLAIVIIQRVP
jgi:hypothetical protein